jgi:site-specific DNA-cytosine methylase
MKILIACEFSGIVRDAFLAFGHDAYSCDLIPTESDRPGRHLIGDVMQWISPEWDMMIAHPPCTYLAVSGNRWMKERPERHVQRGLALDFVRKLMAAPIEKICIENPKSVITSQIRRCDQVIHPWQFGHGEVKETHLWLKNLPKLNPTNIVGGRLARVHRHIGPGPNRQKERSRTYTGIAAAMAEQWGR